MDFPGDPGIGFHIPNAGGQGLVRGGRLRSHMPSQDPVRPDREVDKYIYKHNLSSQEVCFPKEGGCCSKRKETPLNKTKRNYFSRKTFKLLR